jgi:hypothetical protein
MLVLTLVLSLSHLDDPKTPPGMDPVLTSKDDDYGVTKEKPVKLGSDDEYGGPAAEQVYLRTLHDAAGKPVTFKRVGSVGKGVDGNIIDLYEVKTSTGGKFKIYIDMYHPNRAPEKQLAPKGLYKKKS